MKALIVIADCSKEIDSETIGEFNSYIKLSKLSKRSKIAKVNASKSDVQVDNVLTSA